jgi:hypothetical protein
MLPFLPPPRCTLQGQEEILTCENLLWQPILLALGRFRSQLVLAFDGKAGQRSQMGLVMAIQLPLLLLEVSLEA